MKITKRQLRKIIDEANSRLVSEMRPPLPSGYDTDNSSLDEVDELVQAMFAAYNIISARLDDAEDSLPTDQLTRAEQLLDVLEKLSEDINRGR